jgi:hypothetical protein
MFELGLQGVEIRYLIVIQLTGAMSITEGGRVKISHPEFFEGGQM